MSFLFSLFLPVVGTHTAIVLLYPYIVPLELEGAKLPLYKVAV